MKIIDRILDEYYSKKLIERIDCEIRGRFYCDIRVKESKSGYIVEIKNKEFNDFHYEKMLTFLKKEALSKLINFNTKTWVDFADLILREQRKK